MRTIFDTESWYKGKVWEIRLLQAQIEQIYHEMEQGPPNDCPLVEPVRLNTLEVQAEDFTAEEELAKELSEAFTLNDTSAIMPPGLPEALRKEEKAALPLKEAVWRYIGKKGIRSQDLSAHFGLTTNQVKLMIRDYDYGLETRARDWIYCRSPFRGTQPTWQEVQELKGLGRNPVNVAADLGVRLQILVELIRKSGYLIENNHITVKTRKRREKGKTVTKSKLAEFTEAYGEDTAVEEEKEEIVTLSCGTKKAASKVLPEDLDRDAPISIPVTEANMDSLNIRLRSHQIQGKIVSCDNGIGYVKAISYKEYMYVKAQLVGYKLEQASIADEILKEKR